MAQMLGMIGNGAQALFGTSAVGGAASGAAGSAAGGTGLFGSGMFGQAMQGAGLGTTNQMGASLGSFLGNQLMNPSQGPQAPDMRMSNNVGDLGSQLQQMGLKPRMWATPTYDTTDYINKLLSGVR